MYDICLQNVVERKAPKNGAKKVQVSQTYSQVSTWENIFNYISSQSRKQCKA